MSAAARVESVPVKAAHERGRFWRVARFGFAFCFAAPILVNAAIYSTSPDFDWWNADRSSTGLLPAASPDSPAAVRVFAARTVRWRGVMAVHCWIVLKEAGGAYERYDVTAWGPPLNRDRFAPDARWFGTEPETVFAADGAAAEALLPRMKQAIADYPRARPGDYVAWPGPNSNSFVAAVLASVPETAVALPSLAIGKDYPWDGRWLGPTPSLTGVRATLGGYLGVTLGWVEGVEINVLGAVAGVDIRRPAIKLPALGRYGMAAFP